MNSYALKVLQTEWDSCQACPLGALAKKRTHVEVLDTGFRGQVDVVLISEAPGMVENQTGELFSGPSGRILRAALRQAGAADIGIALMNLVACRPQAVRNAAQNRPVLPEELDACWPRVKATVNALQPRAVVAMGGVADQYLRDVADLDIWKSAAYFTTVSPSYVRRTGGEESNSFKFFVRDFQEVFHWIRTNGIPIDPSATIPLVDYSIPNPRRTRHGRSLAQA